MPAETTADPSPTVSELQRHVAELSDRLRVREEEDKEALQRASAVSEILRIINASGGDLTSVFDAMLEKAMRLCEASFGILRTYDGSLYHSAASRGVPTTYAEFLAHNPQQAQPGSIGARVLAGEPLVHVIDVAEDKVQLSGDPHRRALVELGGARTSLVVALTKDRAVLGAIQLYRQHVQAFSDKQISLLQDFAAQAVIAMENARLLTEQREALEQQTATADILRVISGSPTDVQPVLAAVAKAAVRFCGAPDAIVILREGDEAVVAAHEGILTASVGLRRPFAIGNLGGTAMVEGRTLQVADVAALDPAVHASTLALAQQHKWHASATAPMMREGEAIGCIVLRKPEPGLLSPRQIELLEAFAAQAVIALENTRLFSELKESLDYQTATGEVLNVISRSTEDLQPVLDAMVGAAIRLCAGQTGGIAVRRSDAIRFLATVGQTPEFERHLLTTSYPVDRSTAVGRVVLEKAVYHSPDIAADPTYTRREASTIGRQRAVLGVPLMRQGEAIGVIVVSRAEPVPFTERQIGLIKTFADQAVIAMENTRLLSELRQRTDDLTESLEYQTATRELLEVISRSASDIQPVMDTILSAAARLCGTNSGAVAISHNNAVRVMAVMGVSTEVEAALRERKHTDQRTMIGRTVLAGQVIHVDDLAADADYSMPEIVRIAHMRTALGVPLLRDRESVGAIVLSRNHIEPFKRAADCPNSYVRRPGRDRDGERAAAQRAARVAGPADGDQRRAEDH
jgi:GAF domain-containing protein